MATDRGKKQMAIWERLGWTEKVLYRPAKSGLRAREITVLVERAGSETVMSGKAPAFRVTALNDELDGIPSNPAISDAGGDRIDVAERLGGPRVTRGLQRFTDQDVDFVTVEVL